MLESCNNGLAKITPILNVLQLHSDQDQATVKQQDQPNYEDYLKDLKFFFYCNRITCSCVIFFRPHRRKKHPSDNSVSQSTATIFNPGTRFLPKTFFRMWRVVGVLDLLVLLGFFPLRVFKLGDFYPYAHFTAANDAQGHQTTIRDSRAKPEFPISALSKLGHDVKEILNYCRCAPSPGT